MTCELSFVSDWKALNMLWKCNDHIWAAHLGQNWSRNLMAGCCKFDECQQSLLMASLSLATGCHAMWIRLGRMATRVLMFAGLSIWSSSSNSARMPGVSSTSSLRTMLPGVSKATWVDGGTRACYGTWHGFNGPDMMIARISCCVHFESSERHQNDS